ncbi:MAG: hypothetical protein HC882_05730 [Acidobacteria bacterium]|nr:hypothetical protein [Acidobacteriota bacterium]
MQRTGNALVRLALAHRGESYALGTLVPKDNPRWTGPWDCAEFCSWLVFQLTGELFGCRPRRAAPSCADAYTGFWIDDARAAGAIVAIGAAAGLFTAALERGHVGATGALWDFSLAERVLIAGRALWFYIGKLVLPVNLPFIYERWSIDATDPLQWLAPAGILFLLVALDCNHLFCLTQINLAYTTIVPTFNLLF